MSYPDFFFALHKSKPYQYQIEVNKVLASGKNVIIRAPTGSGKTWAVHTPFLYSLVNGNPLSDRLIHILPMRTLVNDLYDKYLKIESKLKDEKIPVSIPNKKFELKLSDIQNGSKYVTIQTGEYPNDIYLQGSIIFSTYDQILSAFLGIPLSISKRMANINHGALYGSILVFDEIHLFGKETALKTTLGMLQAIKKCTQFVIMTASMTDEMVNTLEKKYNAEVIDLYRKHKQSNIRKIRWIERPLLLKEIEEVYFQKYRHHFLETDKKIIIVCNTSNKAQELFMKLSHLENVYLVHGQLDPEQRKNVERQIRDKFEILEGDPAILISTQVIEVGIDITSALLITELATTSSLIQRAGRCARRKGESGEVWVFNLQEGYKGSLNYGPYIKEKAIINNIVKLLPTVSGRRFDFNKEISFMNETTTEDDKVYFSNFSKTQIMEKLKQVIWSPKKKHIIYKDYIRYIDNISVILVNKVKVSELMKEINLGKISQNISLSSKKLKRYIFTNQLDKKIVGGIITEKEKGSTSEYEFCKLNGNELLNYSQIVLYVDVVIYNSKLGVYLGEQKFQEQQELYFPTLVQRKKFDQHSYTPILWLDHSERTLKVMKLLIQYNRNGVNKIKHIFNETNVEKYLWLSAFLHDLGKLQVPWQDGINCNQKNTEGPLSHNSCKFGRVNHALEGATLSMILFKLASGLKLSNEPLSSAALYAIATHHGREIFTKSNLLWRKIEWIKEIDVILKKSRILHNENLSRLNGQEIWEDAEAANLSKLLFYQIEKLQENFETTLVWTFFVRLLRFSDQLSFSFK